jgi:hypothetical protein
LTPDDRNERTKKRDDISALGDFSHTSPNSGQRDAHLLGAATANHDVSNAPFRCKNTTELLNNGSPSEFLFVLRADI